MEEFLKKVANDVNKYINEKVKGTPQQLYEASLHILKAGGKRIRPAILVASGLSFNAQYSSLIPFAAAVELIHNFTLIHDDIMDNDDFRRGVPTVHKLWGVPLAITAGDLLFAKSFEVPIKDYLNNKNIPEEQVLKATLELSAATSIVAEGQALDMMFEKREMVSEKEYLEMIYKKTSALIEASAKIGAILAGADEESVNAMAIYGRNIGMAFQLKDDLLGIYGREEITGKPVFSDLREGKKTLLVIRSLERGSSELKEALLKVLGKKDAPRQEYEKVAQLMKKEGIKDDVEIEAARLMDEALMALSSIEKTTRKEFIDLLKNIAIFIVSREK